MWSYLKPTAYLLKDISLVILPSLSHTSRDFPALLSFSHEHIIRKPLSWPFFPLQLPFHFYAPLHKKATWKYHVYSLHPSNPSPPVLYWIHFTQAFSLTTVQKRSLNKVTSDFRVAKSNDHSSVLILHDLSAASSTIDHPFHLQILSTKITSLDFPSSLDVPSQPLNASSSTSSPRSFPWYFFTQLAISPNVKLLNTFTCWKFLNLYL